MTDQVSTLANQFSQCLRAEYSYIYNLSENLESLEDAIDMLKAKQDGLENRIKIEESNGRQRRTSEVKRWLKKASFIQDQYNVLHSTNMVELERLCLWGVCSMNLIESYSYGKNVAMLLKKVKDPDCRKKFKVVTEATPVPEAEVLPLPSINVGHDALLKEIWDHLMKQEVGIVGLYGMGGVGKTTLLKHINNMFANIVGRFNIVIWVNVSNNATIDGIQEDIAKRLDYTGKEWHGKKTSDRAIDLHNILKTKKFVLLFDNIWEPVDLETVGVPNLNTVNGCKIVFTTRLKGVCASMGVGEPMEIHCLDPDYAWDLFQKRVGVTTLDSHPEIRGIARELAKKCGGLPLALNALGKTMASKNTKREWQHAKRTLSSSTTRFLGMEKNIFHILKYSYDNLRNNQVRSCFLYCSLFPRDCPIDKEKLIDYWICEKLIDENEGREIALDQGHDILVTLIRACLLLETSKDHWAVSMHDMLREMALWITSGLVENEDRFFVQNGAMLCEVPNEKNWIISKRMSLMKSTIKEIIDGPQCPRLTTLLLQDNDDLCSISEKFFQYMPELLVLDLSNNKDLYELPKEILRLAFLRYLDLSYTKIEGLPLDVEELKSSLIHLNLEHTRRLRSLNWLSKFSSLRILRLLDSRVMLDMKLMKELEMLKDLEYVSINIPPSMIQEQWFYDSKVLKCIQEVCIKELPSQSTDKLIFPETMSNLCDVYIENCNEMLEITVCNRSSTNPCFSNISYVSIVDCNSLKDLTWLMFAPGLTHLSVSYSSELEAIISKEKATNVEGPHIDTPFRKLEYLYFYSLPKLKSIYWDFLTFPYLKQMSINMCESLVRLPLDSNISVLKDEEFVVNYSDKEWINKIEWEDEDTSCRFLPRFQHYEFQNQVNHNFRRRQRVIFNP